MPEIRRARDRFCTSTGAGDKETWHSFSFGNHYDPARISFGPIMAINEEHLAPSAGYEPHQHREVDILTWVLEGSLRHEDSTGFGGEITAGTLQHLNAGTGVTHSEVNASANEPLVFVQMMSAVSELTEPKYGQCEIPGGVGLHAGPDLSANAEVFIARARHGVPLLLPTGEAYLFHVTRGKFAVGDELLHPGDEWVSESPIEAKTELRSVDGHAEGILWVVK